MSLAETLHEIAQYDTSLRDWESRIIRGESLVPAGLPRFEYGNRALAVFKKLRVNDIIGKPTIGECMPPWVFDFAGAIFGCYDEDNRERLITEFFLLIAKKNGKSTIAAGLMLTELLLSRRDTDTYMIIAPTKEVALNSFTPAYHMIKNDPVLDSMYAGNENYLEITNVVNGSQLVVTAASPKTVAGKKPTASLVDELWQFGTMKDAESIMSEITGAKASRPEGYTIYLSTQSDKEPAGVFKEKLAYHRAVRDGRIVAPHAFQMIFEFPVAMQTEEEWRDLDNAYIVNPSLGYSVKRRFFDIGMAEASQKGAAAVQIFAAKHLNIEVGIGLRSNRWAGTEVWPQAADKTLTLEEVIRRSECVVVGMDGGGRDDLFGLCVLGRERVTRNWLCWSHSWAHESVLERRPGIETILRGHEAAGELTIIKDGTMVSNEHTKTDLPRDVSDIINVVKQVQKRGSLACVAADPAGLLGEMTDALALIDVKESNSKLVGVPQGIGLMGAIKTVDRKCSNGSFRHHGSSAMSWSVSNLKIEAMATAIRATKAYAGDNKIDEAMAMFDAATVMVLNPEATGLPEIYIL